MSEYLIHYGIKGMKWGVRRYQNADGSYTAAGKERRSSLQSDTKKALKKVGTRLAVAAGIAGVAYLAYKNPDATKFVKDFLAEHKDQAIGSLKNAVIKTGKWAGRTVANAGEAAVTAALAAAGTIAITNLINKYGPKDTDDERTRNRKTIEVEAATAAIRSATNPNGINTANKNSTNNIPSDVSRAVGQPSNRGIDRSSVEYQALFKDSSGNQRTQEIRSIIKSMASAGYDIDQIQNWLNTLSHSANGWVIRIRR